MTRRAAALAVAAAVLVPPAVAPAGAAVPPLPLAGLPCPEIDLGPRTVLLAAGPSVLAPAGVRETAGVPELGLRVLVAESAPRAVEVARVLRAQPGVRWAAVDTPVHALRRPDDRLFRWQWALTAVRAPAAWDVEVGRRNPVITAVLDTGVDATHPELMGHVRDGADFVDGDADATDGHQHGTAVAGVIAATSDNVSGIAGVSWGTTVLAERVLGPDGSGSACGVVAGIVDAVDAGARVLNLSLGGAGSASCPLVYEQALAYAHDHGAIVVAAAGNDGARGNPVDYPAGCDGALAVAATDRSDRAASFSEHGPQVDISAPGVDVLSLLRTPTGGHGYAPFSGTSMAAPMVSGAAALLLSRHPTWTPDQVRARLLATARDLGPRGRDDRYGAGRLDVGRALR